MCQVLSPCSPQPAPRLSASTGLVFEREDPGERSGLPDGPRGGVSSRVITDDALVICDDDAADPDRVAGPRTRGSGSGSDLALTTAWHRCAAGRRHCVRAQRPPPPFIARASPGSGAVTSPFMLESRPSRRPLSTPVGVIGLPNCCASGPRRAAASASSARTTASGTGRTRPRRSARVRCDHRRPAS